MTPKQFDKLPLSGKLQCALDDLRNKYGFRFSPRTPEEFIKQWKSLIRYVKAKEAQHGT